MADDSDTPDEAYIESVEVYDIDDFYAEYGYPDEEPEFLNEDFDDDSEFIDDDDDSTVKPGRR